MAGSLRKVVGRALREPALVASLPEPLRVSAHSGDGQARGAASIAEMVGGHVERRRSYFLQYGETVDVIVWPGEPASQEQTR